MSLRELFEARRMVRSPWSNSPLRPGDSRQRHQLRARQRGRHHRLTPRHHPLARASARELAYTPVRATPSPEHLTGHTMLVKTIAR